jgi:drug/metabolite transporter (DMT)-like permease
MVMVANSDNRSLGELFSELSRDTGTLIRKELELATTEMTSKARIAGGHIAVVAAGGALAHAGMLVILAAIVIALTQLGITAWLSALIVGVVTGVVGYLLVNRGLASLRQTNVTPTQTIETLKEDAKWTTRTPA